MHSAHAAAADHYRRLEAQITVRETLLNLRQLAVIEAGASPTWGRTLPLIDQALEALQVLS